MTQKLYNMYAKIIRLACNNVKLFVCKAEMQNPDTDTVRVVVRNLDYVISVVENIMRDPAYAESIYANKLAAELSITAPFAFSQISIATKVFIDSLIRSRNARMCQKQYIDAMLIEMYMKDAWEYDQSHPHKFASDSAVVAARDVAAKLFSLGSFTNFIFDDGAPHLDPDVKSNLVNQAFDVHYAIITKSHCDGFIKHKYDVEFSKRKEFFSDNWSVSDTLSAIEKEASNIEDRPIASIVSAKNPIDDIMMQELYNGAFANLPIQNKRKPFVNLKARSRDIVTAPSKYLPGKKQFANLEIMTKHDYIMEYYKQNEPADASEKDIDVYYFNCESRMYSRIWENESSVSYSKGRLRFTDGSSIPIIKGDKPFETLHKINAWYASIFGYPADDIRNSNDWLYGSVRRAYTDEGFASYRLAFINAKQKGRIK